MPVWHTFRRIAVYRGGDLDRLYWFFDMIDATLVLDQHGRSTRETKRHRFKDEARYSRLTRSPGGRGWVTPEIPADVVEEALAKAREQITFSTDGVIVTPNEGKE